MNEQLEDKVLNATVDVRDGMQQAATLTLSLATSYAILTEAWEKFHEARVKINDLADAEVEPKYAQNRVLRLLWEVEDLKQTIEAIYALTPLYEGEDAEEDDPEA